MLLGAVVYTTEIESVIPPLAQQVQQMASFDPFEILGVSMGADDRTIKKAYRNLSPPSHS